MANTSSAKKAHRASLRRRVFNLRRRRAIHAAAKKISAGTLPELYQALDKAAKHGTITKNKAARMKSRLTKRVSVAK